MTDEPKTPQESEAAGSACSAVVRRCDQCRFWARLVDTKESYGLCLWYTQRPAEQVIPAWLKAMVNRYANNNPTGSLPPDSGHDCDAFLQRRNNA